MDDCREMRDYLLTAAWWRTILIVLRASYHLCVSRSVINLLHLVLRPRNLSRVKGINLSNENEASVKILY